MQFKGGDQKWTLEGAWALASCLRLSLTSSVTLARLPIPLNLGALVWTVVPTPRVVVRITHSACMLGTVSGQRRCSANAPALQRWAAAFSTAAIDWRPATCWALWLIWTVWDERGEPGRELKWWGNSMAFRLRVKVSDACELCRENVESGE